MGCIHSATIVMGVFLVAAISTTIVKELIVHITHGVAEDHFFHREHSMASFADDQSRWVVRARSFFGTFELRNAWQF